MVSVIVICAASAVFLFLSVQASSIRSATTTTTTTGNAAAADINNNTTDTSGNSILDVVKVNNSNNNNAPRIVGGEITEPNEYLYYVWVNDIGGGTLIAPDIVLFAAHLTCNDCINPNSNAVIVSAYNRVHDTTKNGYGLHAQERFCDKVIPHPEYNETLNINDVALCKLNSPVYIDQQHTKLIVNNDPNEPVTGNNNNNGEEWKGDILTTMGFGEDKWKGNLQDTLNDVSVTYISNELCSQQNLTTKITPDMLCAGYVNGGKDACTGDSGGPIVKKIATKGGPTKHLLVGVVSFGYKCAKPNRPGGYARVSALYEWIRQTSCEQLQSIDTDLCPNNNNSNNNAPCPSKRNLTVSIHTDAYPASTAWEITQTSKNNRIVLSEDRYKYKYFYHNYNSVCLETNECYKFEIKDDYDGMCSYGGACGNYTISLGDEILREGNGKFPSGQQSDIVDNICVGDDDTPTPVPTVTPRTPPPTKQTALPTSLPSFSPVASTSSVVSGISASMGIDTEHQFDNIIQSETEMIVGDGPSRHRRFATRSRFLEIGCEYIVNTKSGQVLATSSDCTDHFSGTELSGVTFCYVFTIILSDVLANADTCNTNRAAESVVRALTDGWYENTIGPVNDVAIVQLAPTLSPTLSSSLSPTVSPRIPPTVSPTARPTFFPTRKESEEDEDEREQFFATKKKMKSSKNNNIFSLSPTVSPRIPPAVSPTARPTFFPTRKESEEDEDEREQFFATKKKMKSSKNNNIFSLSPTVSPRIPPAVSPTARPTFFPTKKSAKKMTTKKKSAKKTKENSFLPPKKKMKSSKNNNIFQ